MEINLEPVYWIAWWLCLVGFKYGEGFYEIFYSIAFMAYLYLIIHSQNHGSGYNKEKSN